MDKYFNTFSTNRFQNTKKLQIKKEKKHRGPCSFQHKVEEMCLLLHQFSEGGKNKIKARYVWKILNELIT